MIELSELQKQEVAKELEQSAAAEVKYSGPKDFTHLHSHSLFSTLDGVGTPDQYITRAKQLGMKSFALTDHGSLAGLPDAYWAAQEHGISTKSIYRWLGTGISSPPSVLEVARLRRENTALKELIGELTLEMSVAKKKADDR